MDAAARQARKRRAEVAVTHELTPATARLAHMQDARRGDPTVRVIILTVMGTRSLFVVIGQEIEVVGEDLDGTHFIMRDYWKMPFTELGEAEVMKIKLHGCNMRRDGRVILHYQNQGLEEPFLAATIGRDTVYRIGYAPRGGLAREVRSVIRRVSGC